MRGTMVRSEAQSVADFFYEDGQSLHKAEWAKAPADS